MNLESFLEEAPKYSEQIDTETRNRIRLSVAAYAYEFMDQPIITDSEFDELAKKIDLSVDTRRPDLDAWFRKNFEPHTGQWVHNHPEKDKLKQIAHRILKRKKDGM